MKIIEAAKDPHCHTLSAFLTGHQVPNTLEENPKKSCAMLDFTSRATEHSPTQQQEERKMDPSMFSLIFVTAVGFFAARAFFGF